jgi:hypothetical protein
MHTHFWIHHKIASLFDSQDTLLLQSTVALTTTTAVQMAASVLEIMDSPS